MFTIIGVLAFCLGKKMSNENGELMPILGIMIMLCGVVAFIYGLSGLLVNLK